jgi:hypothetical protein
MARDYTKEKHSDLIEYGSFVKPITKGPETGQAKFYRKKGKIIEQGAPGTLGKTHDKAMVRLNKIMAEKRKKGGTRTSRYPGTEKARKEKLASLRSPDYWKKSYKKGGHVKSMGKATRGGGAAKK